MSANPNPHASLETRPVPEFNESRTRAWIWWISGLLLLATMLNYMDRQTLANLAVRIKSELSLTNELYGNLEWGFGWSFAAGSLFFGFLADRVSIRFLYPGVLLAWSATGVLTGFCEGYGSLLVCRILLGFFEAGHWPCALRTTKAVLENKNRTMGNSILQSGGALGAILTPPLILLIIGKREALGAWRSPFIMIGSLGVIWAIGWLLTVKENDLRLPDQSPGKRSGSRRRLMIPGIIAAAGIPAWYFRRTLWWALPDFTAIREFFDTHPVLITIVACTACLIVSGLCDREFFREYISNRRFWSLVPVVIFINLTWQLIRAWLPAFLQEGRGATEATALWFNSAYYVAADVGCLAAGAGTLWLAVRGLGIYRTQLLVFGICAAMTSLTFVAARLPLGTGLYVVLLVVAAGSLGLFPCYYSLAQEASERHMGKTTGLLGALAWLVSAPVQKAFGKMIDETHSFDTGLAWAGLAPFLALFALIIVWPRESTNAGKGVPTR